MNIIEELKGLEKLISDSTSLIPGKGLDMSKAVEIINQVISGLPSELDEAGMVSRQKEAIIDQADKEAARIRNYADEEASTMREIAKRDAAGILAKAEEQAESMIEETSIIEGANKKSEEMINEAQSQSEGIVLNAQQESSRMLEESEQVSADRRDGADNYAKEVLYALEERISTILSQVRSGLDLLDDPAENENITLEQNQ